MALVSEFLLNGRNVQHTMIWEPEKTKATVVRSTPLFPNDINGYVNAIDSAGNIYGARVENETSFCRAFLRSARGKITYLDNEWERDSYIGDANDHRQAILQVTSSDISLPYSKTPRIIRFKSVMWDCGTLCELPLPTADGKPLSYDPLLAGHTGAAALNANGDIIGGWQVSHAVFKLILWKNHEPLVLKTVRGTDYSPLGIDRRGNIITAGTLEPYNPGMFVVHQSKIYNIRRLIDGNVSSRPRMLNFIKMFSSGVILAYDSASNPQHSYLLEPQPERRISVLTRRRKPR